MNPHLKRIEAVLSQHPTSILLLKSSLREIPNGELAIKQLLASKGYTVTRTTNNSNSVVFSIEPLIATTLQMTYQL